MLPIEMDEVTTFGPGRPDDLLILAASPEDRRLGLARRLRGYTCKRVVLSVYDGESKRREENIVQLESLLGPTGEIVRLSAKHADPLEHVRRAIDIARQTTCDDTCPRICLDASTFTKKHLLVLLHGLDLSGLLQACHIYYTEARDYHTYDDQPLSEGISSLSAIESFAGRNSPRKDTLLIIFLGYEGRRAARNMGASRAQSHYCRGARPPVPRRVARQNRIAEQVSPIVPSSRCHNEVALAGAGGHRAAP